MRSVMLLAASLACVGHAHKQQVKHAAEQLTEKPYGPHLKKLATLLLASNSMSSSAHSQAQVQQRKMAFIQTPSREREVESEPVQKFEDVPADVQVFPDAGRSNLWDEKGQTFPRNSHRQQQNPTVGFTRGLGDETGRLFGSSSDTATKSQPQVKLSEMYGGASEEREEEFDVVQKFEAVPADVQVFPDAGRSNLWDQRGQTFPRNTHRQAQNPTVGLNWGLADEKGSSFGDSIDAEVEFLRSPEQNADTGRTWGLGDEKGRTFGGSTGL